MSEKKTFPSATHDEKWFGLERCVREKIMEVYDQREEVLKAFVAKYGFEPDRLVQIHQTFPNGRIEWSARRRSDEEMQNLSRMSSGL